MTWLHNSIQMILGVFFKCKDKNTFSDVAHNSLLRPWSWLEVLKGHFNDQLSLAIIKVTMKSLKEA